MNHNQKEAWLKRLCLNGKIDRSKLGDDESGLLKALEDWGIAHSRSEQHITLECAAQLLDVDRIRFEISEHFHCQYQLITQSTNKDALDYFDQHQRPCIALAEMQIAGKGRRGNQWESPFAKNIYCTIGMNKSIKPINLGLLSIVTGIALCKSLRASGVDEVQLKWPNDLYFQQQKLGGILIESRPVSADEYFIAIGFGINVLMDKKELAVISQAATSINMIASETTSRTTILLAAIKQVVALIDSFAEFEIPGIIEAFNTHDALRGQPICVTTGGQSVHGVNAGINASGQIQLDTSQGRQTFSAADISLRGVN